MPGIREGHPQAAEHWGRTSTIPSFGIKAPQCPLSTCKLFVRLFHIQPSRAQTGTPTPSGCCTPFSSHPGGIWVNFGLRSWFTNFKKPLSPASLPAESLWKQEPQLRGFVCPLQAVPDRIMLLPTEAALLELERLVFLNAATRILVSAP